MKDNKKQFTNKFLNECKNSGIIKVCIGVRHHSVPSSESYCFSSVNDCVFSFQPKTNEDVWPPIWGVAQRMNISKGCGNGDQHQIDASNLIVGVYHLRNKKFIKID